MGTTILSFEDRIVIETLRHEKQSLRYIADYLGFSKTTIFNEIHRLRVNTMRLVRKPTTKLNLVIVVVNAH